MNDINSVILEGTIVKPSVTEEPLTLTLTVTLNSEREFRRADGEIVREVSRIPVIMRGALAEYFKGSFGRYKKARVVGSLRCHTWEAEGKYHSAVVLLAEHVEFTGKTEEENNDEV